MNKKLLRGGKGGKTLETFSLYHCSHWDGGGALGKKRPSVLGRVLCGVAARRARGDGRKRKKERLGI